MALATVQIQVDTAGLQSQIDQLLEALEGLPELVLDGFLGQLANLSDFGLETEDIPASGAGCLVLRFRSVALAELRVAALRALDGDIPKFLNGHGGPHAK